MTPRVARKSPLRQTAMHDDLTFSESFGVEPNRDHARVRRHAEDLRRRLKPVCFEWSDEEFERLVAQIAQTKVRGEDVGRAD